MRLWSLHPSYLDAKGLVALWREGLLALHVLRGQTKGYKNHPQLLRFKQHPQPVLAISNYLHAIVDEAEHRNYAFKREKLEPLAAHVEMITVTDDQVLYEISHLKQKLSIRDEKQFIRIDSLLHLEVHPLFTKVAGKVEPWEILNNAKETS